MASRLARCEELSPPYGLTGLPAARAGTGASSATTTTATTTHQYLRALLIRCLLVRPPWVCLIAGRLRSTSAAAPELEPDGQLDRPPRQRGAADAVLEHRDRGVAERRHRLDHRGEAGAQVTAEPDAVEPGHRHVTGDAQAGLLQRRHDPDRSLVVGADQGARHPPGGDDPLGHAPAAPGGEVAVVDRQALSLAGQPGGGPAEPVEPAGRVR